MELVCVRHGRTDWNRAGRFQGQSDTSLDDVGWAQARALGARLAGERFDVALSSDLTRARDTAQAIGAAAGVAVDVEPRLREMRFGSWEGLTWPEIAASQPNARVAPGGESFAEVCLRVEPALRSLTSKLGRDGRALIVSHAAVMHAIVFLMLECSLESALGIVLTPASILRLRHDGRRAVGESVDVAPGRWTSEHVDDGEFRVDALETNVRP